MTIAENAALYSRNRPAVNLVWAAKVMLACLCLAITACKPEKGDQNQTNNDTQSAPKTTIPLRVWFVADPADKPVIERQWQATYDRPIEITIFNQADLLKQEKGQCDVVVYPARLLGDLIHRQWLAELPSSLQARPTGSEGEVADVQPAGWLDQARFDRKLWGVSLSVLTPVLVGNFELPASTAATPGSETTVEQSLAYWQSVIQALKAQPKNNVGPDEPSGDTEVDAMAVSDRFLTIFNSISNNEGRVSVLFDPEKMVPRLNQESTMQTIKLMQEMIAAGATRKALLGNHLVAWNELSGAQPNITLCVPPPASAEVDKINAYSIQSPPANPARSGMRVSSGTNVGLGLVASITKQCQQTSASIEFVRWLASDSSRQGFAKRISGISAESAYAPGSSAWKAQRLVQRLGQQARLPAEPRLFDNGRFRQALGEQVAAAVQNQKKPEEAFQAIVAGWNEIISSADKPALTESYVKSLGL